MMRFRAMLRKEEQRLSTFSTAYITNILDSSDPTDYSRRRLLDVLSSAQAGDFSLLIDIRELTKIRDDPVILTEKQFEIMMREKKKHMELDENAPPVFSKSTCTLEPRVQVSKRVKFSKSGCYIHTMEHERTLRSFNNKVNMTYIEIWNENEGAIDSVDNYIRKSNREAQERTDYIYQVDI